MCISKTVVYTSYYYRLFLTELCAHTIKTKNGTLIDNNAWIKLDAEINNDNKNSWTFHRPWTIMTWDFFYYFATILIFLFKNNDSYNMIFNYFLVYKIIYFFNYILLFSNFLFSSFN